ncbi:MAG: histidine kinase, partial [Flammeovirgaceae bacterium]|nr:histidine kinase [Flammeovirgaceae bacterium]
MSNNRVYSIYEDTLSGIFWIGTDIGLNAFDKKTEKFYTLTTNEGLPNNVIYSILPDSKGNLWISSNKGLIRFRSPTTIDELLQEIKENTIRQRFKAFDINDGLQSNEFSHVSYCRLKTGELAFGGVNGLNIFHPDSILDNPYPPSVYLLDLKINNQLVEIGETSVLTQELRYTTHLQLTSQQNNLIFTYVGINFTLSHRNQYAYILEGYDKNWKNVGNRQIAEYTNLPPGEYVFKVKAANNDGLWNPTPASIKITITPPLWQSFWFRTIVVVLIATLAVSFYKWRVKMLRKQKNQLELEVKKRTEEIVKKNAEIERQK